MNRLDPEGRSVIQPYLRAVVSAFSVDGSAKA